MGTYYEEFLRYNLPSHYQDSRRRHHKSSSSGQHADSCLLQDAIFRLNEINSQLGVDTTELQIHVQDSHISLLGSMRTQKSLDFVLGALESLEGIHSVAAQVSIKSDS